MVAKVVSNVSSPRKARVCKGTSKAWQDAQSTALEKAMRISVRRSALANVARPSRTREREFQLTIVEWWTWWVSFKTNGFKYPFEKKSPMATYYCRQIKPWPRPVFSWILEDRYRQFAWRFGSETGRKNRVPIRMDWWYSRKSNKVTFSCGHNEWSLGVSI